jgi:hemin uptake protein HemP
MRMILVYSLRMDSSKPHQPSGLRISAAPAPLRTADGKYRFDSTQLLRGAKEVEIDHGGAIYRLQETSQGKLILTK